MRFSRPSAPNTHCALAMSMIPSGCEYVSGASTPSTLSSLGALPTITVRLSPRRRFKSRAAVLLKTMLAGSNSSRIFGPRSPTSAGCRVPARNGSRPRIFSGSRRPPTAASSSSSGLASATPGVRTSTGSSVSAKPSRPPRTVMSASPTRRLVARPNSLRAAVFTRYTAVPSATPSASASTVMSSRPGCSRNWASSSKRKTSGAIAGPRPGFTRGPRAPAVRPRRARRSGPPCRRRFSSG